MNRPRLRAYACWIVGHEDAASTINAFSLSTARYRYYLEARDWCPDLKITELRGRSLGGPRSNEALERVAARLVFRPQHRPQGRAGRAYRRGVVVDGTCSATFEILCFDGFVGSYHPGELKTHSVAVPP